MDVGPGDRILCVKSGGSSEIGYVKAGEAYTVEELVPHEPGMLCTSHGDGCTQSGVFLVGYPRGPFPNSVNYPDDDYVGFCLGDFRPIGRLPDAHVREASTRELEPA